MDTEDGGLREVVGRATAEELRGLLIALEGRVVDVGKPHVPTGASVGAHFLHKLMLVSSLCHRWCFCRQVWCFSCLPCI